MWGLKDAGRLFEFSPKFEWNRIFIIILDGKLSIHLIQFISAFF